MKRQLLLAISMIVLVACNSDQVTKEINVKTDYNIETLFICFEIADNGFWNFPFDDFQPMKELARDEFRQYKDHQAISFIDTLVNSGFWLDAMTEVMLKSSALPRAELQYKLDESTLNRLPQEGSLLIERFLNALNIFYVDASMEEYFKEHENYYDNVNKEVKGNLPGKDFIRTMEAYYGKENESYALIPSPTLYHTMGFGKRIKVINGFKVFNIFGPLVTTKDSLEFGYGFNDPSGIDELTVHEFGHSFINPITELQENQAIIDKYEFLFETIKEDMQNQGYRTWRTCVAEHIVRLGEIRIASFMGDSTRADRIRDDYIKNRKFIYLKELENCIQEYEADRINYKSIDAYMPVLLKSFEKVK